MFVDELICHHLTLLWMASCRSALSALVTPVFIKKGDRNKAANYRPISLTVICCKLLEHILHSFIMRHLDAHNILTNVQHGFRKARSCETQLITAVDDIAHNLDNGLQTDIILPDFAKALVIKSVPLPT